MSNELDCEWTDNGKIDMKAGGVIYVNPGENKGEINMSLNKSISELECINRELGVEYFVLWLLNCKGINVGKELKEYKIMKNEF